MDDILHLLNTQITVQRPVKTKDASGGVVDNYVDVPGMVLAPALVQPRRGSHQRTLGQRQVFISHVIYLQDANLVRRGDRVYHPEKGVYYTCHGVEDMAGQQGRVWRIECSLES